MKWQDKEKVAKVAKVVKELVKLVLKDTLEKVKNQALKVSLNQLLEDSQEEVVLKEFQHSSTMTVEPYLKAS